MVELIKNHIFSALNLLESSQIIKRAADDIGSTFVSGHDFPLVFFFHSFRYFRYKIIFSSSRASVINKESL